jgi:ABC-type nickel/cobalt efflux system permease component RcnA
MHSFSEYLAQGNAWLFIPAAIALGALHGLEPGHSKTMMAAFIVAIRGTVRQAVLLGLSATLSHTAVIWALAFVGLHYSGQFTAEQTEPYFQLVTGALVVGMAGWMFIRTRRGVLAEAHHHHSHSHPHSHDHDHEHGHHHHHDAHDHDHPHEHSEHSHLAAPEYEDEHEREHAEEIEHRFADRRVTTGQLILFGLTGGLMPCPAAFAVLLVCLQLKKFTLGFALVVAFSVGLAITLVSVGAIAALSVRHASKHFTGFGKIARKMPYVSSVVMLLIGIFIALQGARHLWH